MDFFFLFSPVADFFSCFHFLSAHVWIPLWPFQFSYSLPFLLAKGERGLGDSVFTQRGRDVLIHFTASYKGELTILPVLCARPSTVCARNEQRKQQRKQRPDVGPR